MFKHFVEKSDKKVIYLLIAILALVITLISALFFLPLKKYQLKVIKVTPKQPKDIISYVAYDDLNHDDFNEKILIVKYKANAVDHFIKVFDKKDSVVFKFALNKKRERWLPSTVWTGDFDGDSLKEVYIFSARHFAAGRDSIFLYVFNPFGKNKIVVNRKCVLNSVSLKNKGGKPFNPKIKIVGLFNLLPGFPQKELVYSAFSGDSAQPPHNLFAFDIVSQKVVRKSPYLYKSDFLVEKKDGNVFFYPDRYKVYKDKPSFFFVLDQNLNKINKKKIELKNVSLVSFNMTKNAKFLFYHFGRGKSAINFVDSTFNIKSHKIECPGYWLLKQYYSFLHKSHPIENIYFYSNSRKKIYKIDDNRTLNEIFAFKRRGDFFLIDNAFLRSGILKISSMTKKDLHKLTIFQKDFKNPVSSLVFVPKDPDRIFSIKKITPGSMILSISTQSRDIEILYGKNPYYYLNLAFMGLEFGAVYFILYIMFLFINTLIFYYHFLARHLNTVDKGVLLLSFEGKVLHYNKNFVRLLDLKKNIRLGINYAYLFEKLPQLNNFVEKLIGSDRDLSEEITLQKENSVFKGKLVGYHLTGISGLPSGYSIELYDLSERILTEREEVITRLIRKMAHDIRTPLSTIKFSIETIKYVLPPQEWEKIREDIETMSKEVKHVQAITDNYSKFARLSRQNLQVISLKEVITTVLSKYELPETIKVTMNVDEEAEIITADGKQFELMIKELFENALDAIGNEGEIRFDIFPENGKKQEKTARICLRIGDNGKGIPKEIIDRIFEPNFSTKGQGTGFGLVLVQRIVQNHNGTIWVDSEVGKGTQIHIVLPKDHIPSMNPKE